MQAKDIMTTKVVSVSEDTPIHEVVGLLLNHAISAVPVVDSARRVVGMVSEGDLLRPEGTGRAKARRPWWLEAILGGQSLAYETQHGRTAGAVMTRNVLAVNDDTPINEIAALLERHRIKRVPVLSNGTLAGIVSRANLLHGLATTIVERHEPGAAADRQLRERLLQALLETPGLNEVFVNVIVRDGKVSLWGVTDNPDQAVAAERAARRVPGVKSVENNLAPGPVSGVPI